MGRANHPSVRLKLIAGGKAATGTDRAEYTPSLRLVQPPAPPAPVDLHQARRVVAAKKRLQELVVELGLLSEERAAQPQNRLVIGLDDLARLIVLPMCDEALAQSHARSGADEDADR